MARLWTSGFELQSTTAGMEVDSVTGTATINTSTKRSGAASLRCNPSATTGYFTKRYKSANSGNTYLRFYIYIATNISLGNVMICNLSNTSSIGQGGLRIDTNRQLQLIDGSNAAVGSLSTAIPLNTWTRIELMTSDGGTKCQFWIDGVSQASGGSFAMSQGYAFVGWLGNVTGDMYLDDIAINDATGSVQNAQPGEGKVVHIWPDSGGDGNQWFRQDGSSGDNANRDKVDDNPTPNDATDYLKVTTTSHHNFVDDYNMQSYSSAGIASVDTIRLVAVKVRYYCGQTIAAWCSVKPRIKAAASGTVSEGTLAWYGTSNTWTSYSNNTESGATDPGADHLVSYTKPGTSDAWTPTDIDSCQVGIKANITTFNSELRVTMVCLCIEYAVGGANNYTKSLTETVTMSDSISRANTKIRTDVATMVDSVRKAITRTRSDNITISELISPIFTGFRTLTDSITIVESSTRLKAFFKTVTDTITMSELISPIFTGFRTVTDSVGVSDSSTRQLIRTKSVTDTVTISEVFAKGLSYVKALTDTIGLTDSTTRQTGKARSDTITVTDTITRILTAVRSFLDSLTITDTVLRPKTAVRAFSEVLGLSDVVSRLTGKARSDTVTVSDTLARLSNFYRTITDTITVTDSVTKFKNAVKSFLESLIMSDTASRSTTKARSDSVVVADTLSKIATLYRTLTDSVTVTDTVTSLKAFFKTVVETLTLTDSITKRPGKSYTEPIVVTDTISRVGVFFRTLTDSIVVADLFTLNKYLLRAYNDSVAVGDSLVRLTFKRVVDTIPVTDPFAMTKALLKSFSDSVGITDTVTALKGTKLMTLIDVMVVSDQAIADDLGAFATGFFGGQMFAGGSGSGNVLFTKFVFKSLRDQLTVSEKFRFYVNGFVRTCWNIVDKAGLSFAKAVKAAITYLKTGKLPATYTQSAKPSSTWGKTAKQSDQWTKVEKDECD